MSIANLTNGVKMYDIYVNTVNANNIGFTGDVDLHGTGRITNALPGVLPTDGATVSQLGTTNGFTLTTNTIGSGSGNCANFRIQNMADPVNNQDAATKAFVLANSGGSQTPWTTNIDAGNFSLNNLNSISTNNAALVINDVLSMNSNQIIQVNNPINPQDAATKNYVDNGLNSKQNLVSAAVANDIVLTNSGGQSIDSGVQISTVTPTISSNNSQVPTSLAVYNALSSLPVSGNWTNALSQNGDANGFKIVNLADPVNNQDAATKAFVLANSGGSQTPWTTNIDAGNFALQNLNAIYTNNSALIVGDPISMTSNKIINVGDPTQNQDVATKIYVDNGLNSKQNLVSAAVANDIVLTNSGGQSIDSGVQISTATPIITSTNSEVPTSLAVYNALSSIPAGGNWTNALAQNGDANNFKIVNLADPTSNQDAVNLQYFVDNTLSSNIKYWNGAENPNVLLTSYSPGTQVMIANTGDAFSANYTTTGQNINITGVTTTFPSSSLNDGGNAYTFTINQTGWNFTNINFDILIVVDGVFCNFDNCTFNKAVSSINAATPTFKNCSFNSTLSVLSGSNVNLNNESSNYYINALVTLSGASSTLSCNYASFNNGIILTGGCSNFYSNNSNFNGLNVDNVANGNTVINTNCNTGGTFTLNASLDAAGLFIVFQGNCGFTTFTNGSTVATTNNIIFNDCTSLLFATYPFTPQIVSLYGYGAKFNRSAVSSSISSSFFVNFEEVLSFGTNCFGNGSMNGNKITNLADGTLSTDACTYGQLTGAISGATPETKFNITASGPIGVQLTIDLNNAANGNVISPTNQAIQSFYNSTSRTYTNTTLSSILPFTNITCATNTYPIGKYKNLTDTRLMYVYLVYDLTNGVASIGISLNGYMVKNRTINSGYVAFTAELYSDSNSTSPTLTRYSDPTKLYLPPNYTILGGELFSVRMIGTIDFSINASNQWVIGAIVENTNMSNISPSFSFWLNNGASATNDFTITAQTTRPTCVFSSFSVIRGTRIGRYIKYEYNLSFSSVTSGGSGFYYILVPGFYKLDGSTTPSPTPLTTLPATLTAAGISLSAVGIGVNQCSLDFSDGIMHIPGVALRTLLAVLVQDSRPEFSQFNQTKINPYDGTALPWSSSNFGIATNMYATYNCWIPVLGFDE